VEQGQIGKPGVIRLSRGSYRPKKPVGNWFLNEEMSGGILMDLMIHDFDYARWIAGEVESVYAKKVSGENPGASVDYGLAILKHTSGALSHIAGAWAYPPPTFRTHLEIAGDGGLIEFDSDDSAPIRNLIQLKSGGDAPDVGLPSSPTSESPIRHRSRSSTGRWRWAKSRAFLRRMGWRRCRLRRRRSSRRRRGRWLHYRLWRRCSDEGRNIEFRPPPRRGVHS